MTSRFITDLGSINDTNQGIFTASYFTSRGLTVYSNNLRILDISKFLESMKNKNALIFDFYSFNHQRIVDLGNCALIIGYENSLTVFAQSYKDLSDFIEENRALIDQFDADAIEAHYYRYHKNDVDYQFIEIRNTKGIQIFDELYPDINITELSKAFKNSNESILILYGMPGVGKTTFLKHLIQTRQYKKIAYIKDVDAMISGEFWAEISSRIYDLIIFDDLDFAIGPRKEGNKYASFVSNLLSYSDGIFNHSTKIIITTNQTIDNIDEALVRPGRCFDFLELKPLISEQALFIWTDILKMENKDFVALFNHASLITQASLMSGYFRLSTRNKDRSYMKHDEDFSFIEERLQKAGITVENARRLGFN